MKNLTLLTKTISVFLLLLISGCNKDLDEDIQQTVPMVEDEFQPQNEIDRLFHDLAKNLAKSLNKVEVRNFVKRNAMEQFDGDYNFLIETSKNKTLSLSSSDRSTEVSFGDILSNSTDKNSTRQNLGSRLLDKISDSSPLAQIAVPELEVASVADWDTNSLVPLVAFIPSDLDNSDMNAIIPAFDAEGNYHPLKRNIEPDQLTVVISTNERLTLVENSSSKRPIILPIEEDCFFRERASIDPYYQNEKYSLYFSSDLINNRCGGGFGGGGFGGGGTGGGSGSGSKQCDRDRKSGKDRLHRMIFNSMKEFKRVNDWFDGGQELQVTIFFGKANGSIAKVTKLFTGRDRDFRKCKWFKCRPKWFGLKDVEIVTWDKEIYGNAMLYSWIEKDGGDKVELNSSFSSTFDNDDGTKTTQTFGVKSTIEDKDDILGESVVEYCDNTDGEGYTYNTGKIQFQVRQ